MRNKGKQKDCSTKAISNENREITHKPRNKYVNIYDGQSYNIQKFYKILFDDDRLTDKQTEGGKPARDERRTK